jgi:hypothetical protein
MSGADTLPGCIGYFGAPLAPNGPCQKCPHLRLCKHVKTNFVPKTKLQPILAKVERLEVAVREARGEKV